MKVKLYSTVRQGVILTSSYVLFIYVTLPVMPAIVKGISELGLLKTVIWILFAIVVLLLVVVGKLSGKLLKPQFWLVISIVLAVYYYVSLPPFILSERIHLWLYGLLGFLLFSVLRFFIGGMKLYIYSALLTAFIGFIDELIQYLLPMRTFSLSDMALNSVGGLLSLLTIRFIIGDKGEQC